MSKRPTLAVVRRPRDTASNPVPAPAAAHAVPVPVARETHVYSACKMPLSMFEAVKSIARARGITNSEVIRYFVAQGLLSPFAQEVGVKNTGV